MLNLNDLLEKETKSGLQNDDYIADDKYKSRRLFRPITIIRFT